MKEEEEGERRKGNRREKRGTSWGISLAFYSH
jgi:hypothetical protein